MTDYDAGEIRLQSEFDQFRAAIRDCPDKIELTTIEVQTLANMAHLGMVMLISMVPSSNASVDAEYAARARRVKSLVCGPLCKPGENESAGLHRLACATIPILESEAICSLLLAESEL